MTDTRQLIEHAFDDINNLTITDELRDAVQQTITQLNSGETRIAEYAHGHWFVNEWLKKAVLLYFRLHDNKIIESSLTHYFDKIPLKYAQTTETEFQQQGVRVAPPATARYGTYIAPDVVLMPSYVNIGAYIDAGCMIDTWATIGSCAQIGKYVHISGGAGIGGVLEPLQANPTIIEDHCFIGARSEIVEGVIVERGSVISMGVYIGQSTRIYNRMTDTITYGRIPAGSVVVPGNLLSKDGKYSLYAAIIVKQVDDRTREKVGINGLLRSLDA